MAHGDKSVGPVVALIGSWLTRFGRACARSVATDSEEDLPRPRGEWHRKRKGRVERENKRGDKSIGYTLKIKSILSREQTMDGTDQVSRALHKSATRKIRRADSSRGCGDAFWRTLAARIGAQGGALS